MKERAQERGLGTPSPPWTPAFPSGPGRPSRVGVSETKPTGARDSRSRPGPSKLPLLLSLADPSRWLRVRLPTLPPGTPGPTGELAGPGEREEPRNLPPGRCSWPRLATACSRARVSPSWGLRFSLGPSRSIYASGCWLWAPTPCPRPHLPVGLPLFLLLTLPGPASLCFSACVWLPLDFWSCTPMERTLFLSLWVSPSLASSPSASMRLSGSMDPSCWLLSSCLSTSLPMYSLCDPSSIQICDQSHLYLPAQPSTHPPIISLCLTPVPPPYPRPAPLPPSL